MQLLDKGLLLEEFPLFANLSDSQRSLIRKRSSIREYKKGELIYEEGSDASALYCLVIGRVVIYTKDKDSNKTILEYLHRGKYFGMISLLTAEPHSVTAQALNDSYILVIKKEDFDFILKKIPKLAIDLSRTLSRRLKRKDVHQKIIFESTIISVFSSYAHSGKTIYALNLALSLARETHKSVIVLDIAPKNKTHSLPGMLEIQEPKTINLSSPAADNLSLIKDSIIKTKFKVDLICSHYEPDDENCVKFILGILSLLVNDYHFIVLDLPSSLDQTIFNILNQSDLINLLSSPEPLDLKNTHNLISELKSRFDFKPEKIKVIINEYKPPKINYDEQAKILKHAIYATLPHIDSIPSQRLLLDRPECEYSKAVRRISRQLGDCLVGLVLGVGFAYGFCHIGVIKVIEEENIPVDMIAGSSVGAIVASLWALGKSSDEILQITEGFKEPKHLWQLIDLTFPVLGFIKGKKLYRYLNKYLGMKTFADLKVPLKIIACDIKKKEPKVLDKGLLMDAIMASCTMPGVFRPFKLSRQAILDEGGIPSAIDSLTGKEEMLFDGGVSNPLPTEPLLKMGVRKIIAVNVTPSREDILRQYEKMKENITLPDKQKASGGIYFKLKQYFKGKFKTNILDIIFSSIEILQSEVAQKEAQLADVVLHPDTSGLYWLELHKAEEFAKRGEEEMRKNLDKIWRVINE